MSKVKSEPSLSRDYCELITYFFETSEKIFSSLFQEEYSVEPKVEVSNGGQTNIVRPDEVTGFFLASIKFCTKQLIIEMVYGDRDYYIHATIGTNKDRLYPLFEWAKATGLANYDETYSNGVRSKERIESDLTKILNTLGQIKNDIIQNDYLLIELIDKHQKEVIESWKQSQEVRDYKRISNLAAYMFKEKNFEQVIHLLEPYNGNNLLSKTDKKRLDYSKRHAEFHPEETSLK